MCSLLYCLISFRNNIIKVNGGHINQILQTEKLYLPADLFIIDFIKTSDPNHKPLHYTFRLDLIIDCLVR